MTQPVGRNAKCPCGSGKKYKHCCLKVAREQRLDEEFPDFDRLGPEGELFPDTQFEHVEHGIVEAMKASGIDPAIIYAFEQTGLIISEENQHLISDEDLKSWESAIEEYRSKEPLIPPVTFDKSLCWSCERPLPENAKRCLHCEASVEEAPATEDAAMIMEFLQGMDPSLIDEMRQAAMESENGEEFVNRLMVGSCPSCQSDETGDCENDPEIEDPCVGRCFACSQLFCCDCDKLFATPAAAAAHECPVWEKMFKEDADDDEIDF